MGLFYLHSDHLGSVNVITNSAGDIVESHSFDAWGRRRSTTDFVPLVAFNSTGIIGSRGYTFHEHLDQFGLINMNGRLYDPQVGRMLSPDPVVITNASLNFNAYMYANNNPLKYTDPSGNFLPALLFFALAGGLMNAHMNLGKGNFFANFAIGAVAGAAGFSVGFGVTAALGTGILAGAASGAAGGLVSGFLGGGASQMGNGGSWSWDGALQGALIGGAIGAVAGGVAGGIDAANKGANVWTGKVTKTVTPSNQMADIVTRTADGKEIGRIQTPDNYDVNIYGNRNPNGSVSDAGFSTITPKLEPYTVSYRPAGSGWSAGAGFAFGGGFGFEAGKVYDGKGNSKWFVSAGVNVGFDIGAGYGVFGINNVNGNYFNVNHFKGTGSGFSVGAGPFGFSRGGNNNFLSDLDYGNTYIQNGLNRGYGVLEFGAKYSFTKTWIK